MLRFYFRNKSRQAFGPAAFFYLLILQLFPKIMWHSRPRLCAVLSTNRRIAPSCGTGALACI
jgi:hypothetical protein